MSTYVYLECLDHDPPLPADAESGQHLYDLSQIREDISNREGVVAALALDMTPDDYFRRNTARFLARHQGCRIGIRDEYGVVHPVIEADPRETNQ